MVVRSFTPTLRAQVLGQRLRELREEAGLTLQQAAAFLQRSPSTVSRFETAEYPIRRPDVLALLELYRVPDDRQDELLQLGEDTWHRGWWDRYADIIRNPRFLDYVWLESHAEAIKEFQLSLVTGLLQIADYARETIRRADPTQPAIEVDRSVELRLERQKLLNDDAGIQLEAIFDESVLRRPIGGQRVMRTQLRRLIEASTHPNVDLRVVPFSAEWYPGLDGTFTILQTSVPYPDLVYSYLSTRAGAIYIESDRVNGFLAAFSDIREVALAPDQSRNLIIDALRDLES